MLKKWHLYILCGLMKFFLFFILAFFMLYVIIDYSIYAKAFSKDASLSSANILIYYLCLFVKRLPIIFSLGLTLSVLKLLLSMNNKRELVALFCAGLSKSTLVIPLFLFSSLLSTLLFGNNTLLHPKAVSYLDSFEHRYLKKSKKKGFKNLATYALSTKQGARLIFSKMDTRAGSLYDVYLIFSLDDFWKIEKLELRNGFAVGYEIEHFRRDVNDQIRVAESLESFQFTPFDVEFVIKKKGAISYEGLGVIDLVKLLKIHTNYQTSDRAKILSQLLYKMTLPFLSFLVIIACAPYCMNFSRKLPIFVIYAMSIFGVVSLFAVLDASIIFAESQTLSPWIAILSPLALCFGLFYPKFLTSCRN